MDLGYTHDKVGNILSKSTVGGTTQYIYDDRCRLTGVDAPGTADDETYSYDPAGNRITAHNTTTNWQYNGNNQLQSYGDTALEYDANGNTVKESDASTVPATLLRDYFYDPQDRLTEIKDGASAVIANYDYDPLGRRIRKTVSGVTTYYLYSDDGLIAEYDVSGNETQGYGYVPGSPWGTNPLYTKTASGYAFYHTDHLGTPQMLTAKNGAKLWEGKMDAFGQMTITTETVTNNLRFPGQYYDQESGQHYNYFRNYDPGIGRYTTSDPLGLLAGFNPFVYIGANPLRFTDPFGLISLSDALSFVPVVGSLLDAYDAYQCGNFGMATLNVGLAILEFTGVGLIVKGLSNAIKVAKILKLKKKGSNTWDATRKWYNKNVVPDKPIAEHIHHWLVEKHIFNGNPFLEKIFNQPWNLNPKPFGNLYHNTVIHNNGITGWLKGVPDWVKSVTAGSGTIVASEATSKALDCEC